MNRKIFILFLFLLCYGLAADYDPKTAQISFTAGLIANLGFTSSPVGEQDYIKPTELTGDSARFEFEPVTYTLLSTDPFYIYYQIFTPHQLKVYAEISPLSPVSGSTGTTIEWTDSSGTITGSPDEQYGYLIFEDAEADKRTKPRVDSVLISPVIEGDDLDLINWDSSYEGTITLKVVVG